MWRKTNEDKRYRNIIKKTRKKRIKIFLIVLLLVLSFACLVGFLSVLWVNRTWPNLSIDELLYTINSPLEGTNEDMIKDYFINSFIPAMICIAGITILANMLREKGKSLSVATLSSLLSIALLISSVGYTWNKLDVSGYVKAKKSDTSFIDEHYVDPHSIQISAPEEKRNLIYIYLESMETTYSDKEEGGAFDVNYIPELTSLAKANESFAGDKEIINGGIAMPGSTWTIAAIFGQSAGLPLNIEIEDNSMDTQEHFFGSTVTIGDVLDQAGYNQAFMIGSDATFGGRRTFYTDHGDYDIYDYLYAQEEGWIPEDYRVFWGYEDQRLFENAKLKLQDYADEDEPFNFTMLTVDTHFEDGYVCELCEDSHGDDQYGNVISCSDKLVDDFVKWVQDQDFYEDTTIVIAGDHPTMDSNFCEEVGDYGRKVYVNYINAAKEVEVNAYRDYTTFDLFPTTLSSLGFTIEGNRLGLGTDLFSGTNTLLEIYGENEMRNGMLQSSKILEDMANLDPQNLTLLVREGAFADTVLEKVEQNLETGDVLFRLSNLPEAEVDELKLVGIINSEVPEQAFETACIMERQDDGSYLGSLNTNNLGGALVFELKVEMSLSEQESTVLKHVLVDLTADAIIDQN
ncbi:phosphoglycerol transferase [Lachnospiraceae bacterium PF1-21]|uniref:LTA synthase family protein n=1 Tax=Ohessyouella blattaphilus TaxID=2949333 RepID=UPI003E1ABD9B